ncbi:RsmE family RNA methyltransferase [Pseudobacteriovorax antillogorgiicola]|uniref:Ribosomal RNA small subunit methyltransferase E n=1 Tax=Pseudobacteriovorax antillogorgiicola TaxID=1513793 RepID=A0A1Y6B3L7_9BACT|nr:RsmE family RNA methyltransferase [Pseudobacteriovorax antillogorgiicola]TCS59441.1 RsmE family RNA methyltransferase [Pseudobacteriovorax antillogorgiicola]SME88257.1 RNA methyltransferase, RsmE family [Pseudobacteriovorax antillogorgiicola]
MAHLFRFIGNKVDGRWHLDPDECHHFLKVLRLQDQETIEVCNGEGLWAIGVATIESKTRVGFEPREEFYEERAKKKYSIAMGAIKPGDFDDVLPSLIELGVDGIHLFRQSGGDKARVTEKTLGRWEKIAKTAIKQCKRSYLPQVIYHDSIDQLVKGFPAFDKCMVLEASAPPLVEGLDDNWNRCLAVLGSERGLNQAERELLKSHQCIEVSIAPYVLRARTAAISFASIIAHSQHGI